MYDHMEKLASLRRMIDQLYYRLKYTQIPRTEEFLAVGGKTMKQVTGLRESIISTEFRFTVAEDHDLKKEEAVVRSLRTTFYLVVAPQVSEFYNKLNNYKKG